MDDLRLLRVRLTLGAAFLLMGFSFSITQALLVREMLVSFAGNELSIGLVLGSWLLLEAAGSGLLGRLIGRLGRGAWPYARLQVLFALLLLPVLALALGVRHLLGGVPGQGLGLPPIFFASFLLLIPLGLVDGMMFTTGCRLDDDYRRGGVATVGRVYVYEAVGGIVGGLIFTYLFVPYLHAVQIALILAALNLGSALSLVLLPSPATSEGGERGLRRRPAVLLFSLLLILCLGLLLTPGAQALQRRLVAWQWRGYDLAFYDNSVYGNVAAIRQGEQVTFFANGVPILTAPVPDVTLVEEMVHLPLLFVPQPRRALVLSGGLGGVIHELLKYPLERVDYAELDPLLIEAVASLPTPLTEAELSDPRLHIEQVDGRLLVRRLLSRGAEGRGSKGAGEEGSGYDLVLINLPYPTTLQLNRFYTVEFWGLVRGLLADDGVVVFPAPGSLTYLSPAMRDLNNALLSALAQVFPHVRPIPGDVTLWLASLSPAVEARDVEPLVARWQARRLPTALITDFHIRLRLDERWLTWFWASLQEEGNPPSLWEGLGEGDLPSLWEGPGEGNPPSPWEEGNPPSLWEGLGEGRPVAMNRDLRPSGLLYGLAYWNEMFSPGLTPYFDLLRRLSLPVLLVPLLLLVLVGVVLVRRRWRTAPIPFAIAATGFGGMTADLLIIFAFQVFYGYVYQLIGLLITAFMVGLSLGGWLMARREERGARQERRILLGLEGALVAFWLVLPAVLTLLYRRMGEAQVSALVGPALLALNVLAGFLVGMQFPLANKMYLRRHPELSGTAGALYAADLVGAFAAALLVSVALLPALGMVQTCVLVAGLKAGSFALVLAMRR
ncbi:MAG: hypothetical protein QHJ81_14875 [Anaerolineae bacterium]|nr:hypothetical protein [Anaerolineae bacterium]